MAEFQDTNFNVSFNETDLRKAAREPVLAACEGDEFYAFVIDKVSKTIDKNGNLVLSTQCSPLDPEDMSTRLRPSVYHRVTLELSNPTVDGHEAPTYAKGFCREFFQAVDPENNPRGPHRDENGVMVYQGNEIDTAEIDGINDELAEARLTQEMNLWNSDGKELVGGTFFAQIKHSDFNGKTYANLKRMRCQEALPDGYTMKDPSTFSVYSESAPVATKPAPAKGNGANGKAKPAAKSAAKKPISKKR